MIKLRGINKILPLLFELKSNLNSFLIFNYLCKKHFLIPTSDIFSISNQKQFEKIALKVFRFQYENNLVYKAFCDFMKVKVQEIKSLQQIPFLPIQFFKSHTVVSNTNAIQETFTSSGFNELFTSSLHDF